MTHRLPAHLAPLALGMGCWTIGLSRAHPLGIGSYGLLPAMGVWPALAVGAIVAGMLLGLNDSRPRDWLLGFQLLVLIVIIHSAVPILYHTPEYAWVYKHIGVVQALGHYGRVSDPTNIYQRWPGLFAATAAVAALARTSPVVLATWVPLAFELADALLLLAIFRLLTERRVAYLAVLLYVGLVAWVGQDYLSPQAFSYLLWLGMVLVIVRWLRTPLSAEGTGLLRALRRTGLPKEAEPERRAGWLERRRRHRIPALTLTLLLFVVIVSTHQLTPFMVLAAVAALTAIDLIRPRWMLPLLMGIAVAYMLPRYSVVSQYLGGVFKSVNPIKNASGVSGAYHAGAEATTAWIVRGMAGGMWLLALVEIFRCRRVLGRIVVAAVLAFTPFFLLVAQDYGGEAIYRVFLFSCPWCAVLIASLLYEERMSVRRLVLVAGVCLVTLFAGLQGLYGPVSVNGFTTSELSASRWLYGHIPRGSLIVLPVVDFPVLQVANYNDYELQLMPAEAQAGDAWMDEAEFGTVREWMATLGHPTAYVVVSKSMGAHVAYYGEPRGYMRLVRGALAMPGWRPVYRDRDVTIYRVSIPPTPAAKAPAPAAPTPATVARAWLKWPVPSFRASAFGNSRIR